VSIVSLFSQTTGLVLRLQSLKKKFRNQTGAIAGIDGDHSRASIHLGRFALSKTNNYSNNQSKNDYIIALKRNQKKLFKPAVKISSHSTTIK
jgi:hypothetical protein